MFSVINWQGGKPTHKPSPNSPAFLLEVTKKNTRSTLGLGVFQALKPGGGNWFSAGSLGRWKLTETNMNSRYYHKKNNDIYIYVYNMYTYNYIYNYIQLYIYTHKQLYIYIQLYLYTHTSIYIYIHINSYIYIHIIMIRIIVNRHTIAFYGDDSCHSALLSSF